MEGYEDKRSLFLVGVGNYGDGDDVKEYWIRLRLEEMGSWGIYLPFVSRAIRATLLHAGDGA